MALTNAQYNSIMRSYEEKQTLSARDLSEHKAYVREHLPAYYEIESQETSLQLKKAACLMDGDKQQAGLLTEELALLRAKKASILSSAGLPADYLQIRYDCKYCKDTGYIDGQKCNCFKMAAVSLLYEQSGIQELLKQDNFDNLSYDYYSGEDLEHFKNAVCTCQGFVKNFNSDYHNLFFYGTVGVGKSFLSGCVAKELIERGHVVIYFSAGKLFSELSQAAFDHNSKEAISALHHDLYTCDLLIIDDLGTELTNSFVASELFAILNERNLRKKATIISTNLSLMNLQERYGDRTFSRIAANYEMCKLSGQDIRMYKKRQISRK